ncbi:MBL fold metallo-hydrolase [Oceanivirga salmonicida]|uniref:MBL fold metallo-hydrolase n=1 Tax=Oceanivirga salmonicida TaxID=1769291 RepID=UPI0012E294C2|nr:MBL fold metallo-hydrolase [Oceanivirga salmonicida]
MLHKESLKLLLKLFVCILLFLFVLFIDFWNFIKLILLFTLIILILTFIYINVHPAFGDKPNKDSMLNMKKSPNFDGNHFTNIDITSLKSGEDIRLLDRIITLKSMFFPQKGKNPTKPIKTVPINVKEIKNGEFAWLGHSTVLFKTNDTTIITDPVFYNAAPVFFAGKPFAMTNKPQIKDLPHIDIVLISHDHYDHLDYYAIKEMHENVSKFYVPLGVKAHLLYWGVADEKISEYDWYDEVKFNDIRFVFTPSRHFSGRNLDDIRLMLIEKEYTGRTLWGSWAVISPNLKAYFSGDGGYTNEFLKLGEMFDGFDIAFMENGAYNKVWSTIHMMPEETAKAIIDIKAKVALPIHWGKFDLSNHRYNEPPERIINAINNHNEKVSEQEQIKLVLPKIGEIFSIDELPYSKWWEN